MEDSGVDELSPEERAGALRDMVQSAGWRLLVGYADANWGPRGLGFKMVAAIEGAPAGPEQSYEISEAARRVHATARAVNEIITWPEQQLRMLTEQKAPKRAFDRFRRSPDR